MARIHEAPGSRQRRIDTEGREEESPVVPQPGLRSGDISASLFGFGLGRRAASVLAGLAAGAAGPIAAHLAGLASLHPAAGIPHRCAERLGTPRAARFTRRAGSVAATGPALRDAERLASRGAADLTRRAGLHAATGLALCEAERLAPLTRVIATKSGGAAETARAAWRASAGAFGHGRGWPESQRPEDRAGQGSAKKLERLAARYGARHDASEVIKQKLHFRSPFFVANLVAPRL
jgi:hypothetical protein